MSRGRPRKAGLRRPNGRLSEARNAKPEETKVHRAQPHRVIFARLFKADDAALDSRCGFALGRLRLLGLAEERGGAQGYMIGLSERLFLAGERYGAVVARERYARGSPNDKARAIDWLSARGLSLSDKEMSPLQRAIAVADFEDARAVLRAAAMPADVQKVHSKLLQRLRDAVLRTKVGGLEGVIEAARVLPSLVRPVASDTILTNVNAVVVADRDPVLLPRAVMMVQRGAARRAGERWSSDDQVTDDACNRAMAVMEAVRRGLTALDHHFGADPRSRSKRPDGAGNAFFKEKPTDRPDIRAAAEEADEPTRAKPDRDHPFR